MTPILSTRQLCVRKGDAPLDFTHDGGFQLITMPRESGASTMSMALAGRFKPFSGEILLHGEATTPRQRFKAVALAGVTMIDSLERSVSAKEVLTEQLAWSMPFFARVPRSAEQLLEHPQVAPWLEPLQLENIALTVSVGTLSNLDRLRLRTLLALVARPQAQLLVVDDPDQLRSMALRAEFLANLRALAEHKPVLAISVNEEQL